MDVHPPKTGMYRYWSIPIWPLPMACRTSTLNTKCLAAWQLTKKNCHVYSSKHVTKIYYVTMHPHSTSTKSKTKNKTILWLRIIPYYSTVQNRCCIIYKYNWFYQSPGPTCLGHTCQRKDGPCCCIISTAAGPAKSKANSLGEESIIWWMEESWTSW